jgi:uncharacterized membrane protein YraQ (UPF0718 family)
MGRYCSRYMTWACGRFRSGKVNPTMFDQIVIIADLIVDSFLHIWPYLLVTIPLAVAAQMSRASEYISHAFKARPLLAIFLATAVGAFSPFCSSSVVPIVAAALISGVPLAPVMSFWIASPSMDPEMFFLSVATLGWELAVWRLSGTLLLSLGAGLTTHFVMQQGWLGSRILRAHQTTSVRTTRDRLQAGWRRLQDGLSPLSLLGFVPGRATHLQAAACCSAASAGSTEGRQLAITAAPVTLPNSDESFKSLERVGHSATGPGSYRSDKANTYSGQSGPFWRRLLRETWDATWMVVKFMFLAFFLSALIKLYVPSEWIVDLLGQQNPWAIPTAALLGMPTYASNMTALPMLSGLLGQGMSPSTALTFLIAGPTTTLSSMAAVWGLASRRVFALYVSFSLVGAVALGYLHSLLTSLS